MVSLDKDSRRKPSLCTATLGRIPLGLNRRRVGTRDFLCGSLLLSLCVLVLSSWAGATRAGVGSGQEAIDQYGNIHKWTAEPGAVTIVDFAASWCGPCRETLPRLEAFATAHPEVRVLVISVDDAVKGRDALVHDLGLKVPVLWDEDHRAAEFYQPRGMPATFLFDAKGAEILSVVGSKEDDWRELLTAVEEALR